MRKLFFAASLLLLPAAASAQAVDNPDDALGNGYITRPYLRYEAEDGFCSTNGSFISAVPYTQENIASEASNGRAIVLDADGGYVEWTLDRPADAMCLRFSLPDSPDGSGTRQTLAVFSAGSKLMDLELDSYWAWQYTPKANSGEKYPDNTPSDTKFARMRFDEVNTLLPRELPGGTTLRLVLEGEPAQPVTIDFVELEKAPAALTFSDIRAANKVEFTGGNLVSFINANGGKTIFIPAGSYDVPRRIIINTPGTRIVGAGMWHTTLFFSASSDNSSTYSQRGIECEADNCGLEGLSLNTINNRRYFRNNSAYQVGKALMGSWGKGSVVRDVRADHFECGAWIADYSGRASEDLTVENCRFRNNYADGINLSSGTRRARVTGCSFRNNGDDDMASWSSNHMASDCIFEYCTAENNWRASSLGFFGGSGHRARHIAVADAMEAGVRVNCDFSGTGFSASGTAVTLEDISIRRAGCRGGAVGSQGDFWGNANPSLWFSSGTAYELRNVEARRIAIFDSRWQGVRIQAAGGRPVLNLDLEDISVNGVENYEYAFYIAPGVRGNGTYSNLTATGVVEPAMSPVPAGFDFRELVSGLGCPGGSAGESLTVSVAPGCAARFSGPGVDGRIALFSVDGTRIADIPFPAGGSAESPALPAGVYIAVFTPSDTLGTLSRKISFSLKFVV